MNSTDNWAGNTSDPSFILNENEMESLTLIYGSFLSILINKKINHANMLLMMVENKKIRECFKLLIDIESDNVLIHNLIIKYPVLCKSKTIKSKLKQMFKNDRKRKRNI